MRVLVGDVAEILPTLDAASFDACLCDPPYGLKFMGKAWDHGVPGEAIWREVLRCLKPGAPLLAFGGTRTHHRLMVAIEDAGLEIRDALFYMFGAGFPKSLAIDKAIDKAAGAEVRYEKYKRNGGGYDGRGKQIGQLNTESGVGYRHIPTTPEAARWQGYGTALKPAYEIIVLAMAPLDGTFAENALAHGVAGLNIDGCRIEMSSDDCERIRNAGGYLGAGWRGEPGVSLDGSRAGSLNRQVADFAPNQLGRWPANVVLSHLPECREVGTRRVASSNFAGHPDGRKNSILGEDHRPRPAAGFADADGLETVPAWECAPGCPVRMLDEQSGERMHGAGHARTGSANPRPVNYAGAVPIAPVGDTGQMHRFGDTGGASRFFFTAKAPTSERWGILTCDCQADSISAWQSADQNQPGRMDATSQERAISEETSTGEGASPTTSRGRESTGQSRRASRSTTSTETSSIIDRQTFASSAPRSTSESTPGVSCVEASGGNLAESVGSSSRSDASTGISRQKVGRSTAVVGPVTSLRSSKKSVCESCGAELRVTAHPTQKPLDLCEWLARLILPPKRDTPRRLLVPFAGSGSEMIGALLAGWDEVVGIELSPEYAEIARARLSYWELVRFGSLFVDRSAPETAEEESA